MAIVRTLKGKEIDIDALREASGATIALGNTKTNARGDILGRGGEIIKTKEDVVSDYYNRNPKAVTISSISLKDLNDEVMTPAQAIAALDSKVAETKTTKRKIKDSED